VLAVSVYRIPIFFVRWKPPVQSASEMSAFGGEIKARGSLHYIGRFFSQREPFFAGIRFGWIALAVAVLTLICVFVPALTPVFLGVLIINLFLYWGSFLFALAQYAFWLRRCRRAYAQDEPIEAEVEVTPAHDTITQPSPRSQRTPKVTACIRVIESDLLKRPLSQPEENDVAELCGALLSMALGNEKIVVRLVKLEWSESTDVVDALRRAQDRWERDHNRFV
jgi:hypothetical protein